MKSPRSLLPAFKLSSRFLIFATAGAVLAACGGNDSSGGSAPQAVAARQIPASQKTSINDSYRTVVEQLYVAFFGRPADPTGLANFEAALAAANAPTDAKSLLQVYGTNPAVKQLIDSFGTSKESVTLYGSGTTTQFVQAIFTNVLNRQPAQAGLDFWVNAIDSGSNTRGNASLAILVGAFASSTDQALLDQQLINNRIAVAGTFTADVQTPEEVRGYAGAAAAQSARSMLALVTATTDVSGFATTIQSTVTALARYQVGGTLSGLGTGGSVVLLDNGGDPLTLSVNGSYDFATPLLMGANYAVTVGTQPVGQSCSVTLGSGQIVSDVVVANVACHFPYAYVFNLGSGSISQYIMTANGDLTADATASVSTGKNPSALTVAPNRQSVYVTNQGDNTVSQFSIGAGGALSFSSLVKTQSEPSAVAITPNGKYAYVTNFGTTTVSQYNVASNGTLTAISPATASAGASPTGVVVDPTSSFVYVLNSGSQSISQYTIGAGGVLTPMATATVGTGVNPSTISISPNGKFVYVVNDAPNDHSVSQYGISAGGALVALSPAKVTVGSAGIALSFDPATKNAYRADTGGTIWQLSVGSTGALSQVGSISAAGVNMVAVDPSGRFAYATSDSGTVFQFAIGANGGLTPLAPATVSAGTTPYGIALSY